MASPQPAEEKIEPFVAYRTSLFFMMSSMIGIGYLTLPNLCADSGIVLTLLIIFACGIASLFGTYMLVRAYLLNKSDCYPDVVKKVLGQNHYIAIMVVLITYVAFSTIVYAIIG